jgi:hypothetical protein
MSRHERGRSLTRAIAPFLRSFRLSDFCRDFRIQGFASIYLFQNLSSNASPLGEIFVSDRMLGSLHYTACG